MTDLQKRQLIADQIKEKVLSITTLQDLGYFIEVYLELDKTGLTLTYNSVDLKTIISNKIEELSANGSEISIYLAEKYNTALIKAELNEKVNISKLGVPNGIAVLDSNGLIKPSQLPSSINVTSVGTLDDNGVTPGSYSKVTIDSKGLVTAGDNPTTIAGYGITDAYTKTETDNKDSTTLSSAKSYTDTAIANLVNSAPTTLDTLKEIADQLAKDESGVAALTNIVGTKAPIDSPAFTGTPTAPTATAGPNTTQIATTAFVTGAVNSYIPPKLATGRVLKVTGDISFTTPAFDGSSDISATATLPDVVTAGSYSLVTVNSKGLITAGSTIPTYTQEVTADDGQTQITLNGPKGSYFAIFKNGIRISSSDWSVSGTTLTFNNSLSKNDIIIIDSIA
jgi:phage-related tail fiber protein